MAPTVNGLRELIYWQYANISDSAELGEKRSASVLARYEKLKDEEFFRDSIRGFVREREVPGGCYFCGATEHVSLEHLFPKIYGGPDEEGNMIWVCRSCNSSRGGRRPYEYWTHSGVAKRDVSRMVEAKYLKFLFETLSDSRHLDWGIDDIQSHACPGCNLSLLCSKNGTFHKLSPLCLDGVATLSLDVRASLPDIIETRSRLPT